MDPAPIRARSGTGASLDNGPLADVGLVGEFSGGVGLGEALTRNLRHEPACPLQHAREAADRTRPGERYRRSNHSMARRSPSSKST